MARKFRQANEGFDWVCEGKTDDEKIARLKEWASVNQTVVPMVRWGVGAEEVDWGLPEGMPATAKLAKDLPDGMGDTTIQMEWRRISTFTNPESNLRNVPQWKREMNWLQILEGLHHKEASVLTAIKDKALLTLYPLESSLKGLGITEYNKPKKKRTSKKK